MPKTRIYISKSGRILIEGIGFQGNACIKDLEEILAALKEYGVEAEIEVHKRKQEGVKEAVENVQ